MWQEEVPSLSELDLTRDHATAQLLLKLPLLLVVVVVVVVVGL